MKPNCFRLIPLFALFLLISCTGGDGEDEASEPIGPQIREGLIAAEEFGDLPTLEYTGGLSGTDSNDDGIRDDIGEYIATNSDTAAQRSAMEQYARSIQSAILVDKTNQAAVQSALTAVLFSVTCLSKTFQAQDAERWRIRLESMTINTEERLNEYADFNEQASGGVYSLPALEDSCE